jgi:hypothetical protein
MGSSCLLTHTEVKWHSHGDILTVLFEHKDEEFVFPATHSFQKASCMQDAVWLQALAHLTDIFLRVNYLSLSLQGSNTEVFNMHG